MPKQQLPAITPAHAAFNKRANEAQDRTTKYVVPLYAMNDQGKTYCLGSAVLLKIVDQAFLISAAHVFDENQNPKQPTNIAIVGKHQLIPLGGGAIKSQRPPSGKRSDDKIDIAVVDLSTEIADELDHFSFLDVNQVDPSDAPYKQSLYTFTGYPSTKQKPIKDVTLTIEPVRYTSGPLQPDKYPAGYELGPHSGIDYNRKQMIARSGKVQAPPDPHGVSGGGIFRLGTFDQIVEGTNREVLVGIAIEDHKTSLIGTNITFALEMIRAYHPALDQYIPHGKYNKISATKASHN